jgi:2-methylcitrate dehydratase PrpD
LGGGGSESSILGEAGRVSAPAAAFANAELINVMDMDVVTFPGHVAPAVVAGRDSNGEARCSPGKAIIEAIAWASMSATALAGPPTTCATRRTARSTRPRCSDTPARSSAPPLP